MAVLIYLFFIKKSVFHSESNKLFNIKFSFVIHCHSPPIENIKKVEFLGEWQRDFTVI